MLTENHAKQVEAGRIIEIELVKAGRRVNGQGQIVLQFFSVHKITTNRPKPVEQFISAILVYFSCQCGTLNSGRSNSCLFTVRRYALHGLSYRNSVRPSVRLSVRLFVCLSHSCTVSTRFDKIKDHDFFTI